MKTLVVSALARSDLKAIRRYSRRRWGPDRGQQYVDLIVARFAWLMLNSSRGARQNLILPGLRRVNVRRHAIFYVEGPQSIEITRILHQQMDHARQFKPTPE